MKNGRITTKDLQIGKKYWCGWKSRWIWYKGQTNTGLGYKFEDICDVKIILTENAVENLWTAPTELA